MNARYQAIIGLPHGTQNGRKHMSNYDRAAQFAPFAALTGYDDAVRDMARRTNSRAQRDQERVPVEDFEKEDTADWLQ